jgi:hypothetical protein
MKMEQYIIAQIQHKDVEHTILKLNEKIGVSIISMDDLKGKYYDIVPIEFTGIENQYDLMNQYNFMTREFNKVEAFVNSFIKK